MQWTAGLHASRMLSGEYRNAFGSTNGRALLKFLADGRWTPENPDARFPRLTFLNKSHYLEDSDLWLMDGSYLRLKVAEIGYTFRDIPAFRKVGVKSLKVYFSGYNLLTLFSDPERHRHRPRGGDERFEYRFLPERAHFQLRC